MVLFSRRRSGPNRGSLSSFFGAFAPPSGASTQERSSGSTRANDQTNAQPRRTRRGNPHRRTRTAPRESDPQRTNAAGINAQLFNEWFESMFVPGNTSQSQNRSNIPPFASPPTRPPRPYAASQGTRPRGLQKQKTLNSYGGADFEEWSIKELKNFLVHYKVGRC